jgi:hypothetical protein
MKRGETGKLIYDFETTSNCEVLVKETWCRVTPREFRSFQGKRRINNESYEGPVYLFKTNKQIHITDSTENIVYSPDVEYIFSKKRIGENFEI